MRRVTTNPLSRKSVTATHDYNRLDRFQVLASDLAKRGWNQARLEKLLGGNLMRLYADAWGSS